MKLKSKVENSNHEHALLSPSAAKKWLACPAALACEFGIPNESGAAAVNGTAMHAIAEARLHLMLRNMDRELTLDGYKEGWVLNEGKGPITFDSKVAKQNGKAVKITDDFVSQVGKYVNYCRPIIDAAEVVEIEYRVNLTRVLHPGVMVPFEDPRTGEKGESALQTFGTADLVAIIKLTDGSYMLIVGDLKTGRHKVLAKENKQMMLYALGLLKVYQRIYDISAVRLVIFQPYAGGADEWDTTPEALEQFGKYAQASALKAIDAFNRGKKGLKPGDFRPGPDQCQWCRFSEQCNAKRKVASSVVEDDLSDDAPNEMSLDQLKAEWDKLPLMRQHIADIEKAMYAALMRGEKVDGLKLVEGRLGNRSWTDFNAVCDFIKTKGLKAELLYKEVAMTPTEAEKSFKGVDFWSEMESFVERKPGQPSITTADDKRPEWKNVSDEDLSN